MAGKSAGLSQNATWAEASHSLRKRIYNLATEELTKLLELELVYATNITKLPGADIFRLPVRVLVYVCAAMFILMSFFV